jgi:hypothetical protein
MKKVASLIVLFTLTLSIYGQDLHENKIIGNWTVKRVSTRITNPDFQPIIDGFKNATFSFNKNGNFNLSTTSNSELFGNLTQMTKNTKWKLGANKDGDYILISKVDNGNHVMRIFVTYDTFSRGEYGFTIDESGLTLTMNTPE